MYHKAVNRCFFVSYFISDQCKIQQICYIVVSLYLFPIIFCPYKYKTQRKSDEAVDGSLAPLKFIPAWFVKSKMIEKIHTTLYACDG